MGQQKSKKCHTLVVGLPDTGKTRLINLLQFGEDCTYLGPTRGRYQGAYMHNGVTLDFCELGGTDQRSWSQLLEIDDLPWSMVYYTVRNDWDQQNMLNAYTTLLHTIQANRYLRQCPLAILVYCDQDVDAVDAKYVKQRVSQLFQVKLLRRGNRPVLVTVVPIHTQEQLMSYVYHLLDWTVENRRIT